MASKRPSRRRRARLGVAVSRPGGDRDTINSDRSADPLHRPQPRAAPVAPAPGGACRYPCSAGGLHLDDRGPGGGQGLRPSGRLCLC